MPRRFRLSSKKNWERKKQVHCFYTEVDVLNIFNNFFIDFKPRQKAKMGLSPETVEGLRITGLIEGIIIAVTYSGSLSYS